LAERANCSTVIVCQIETSAVRPSVGLSRRVAAAVGRSVELLFGTPGECLCGCGGLTFARYVEHHAASRAVTSGHHEANRARFNEYKSRRRLIETRDLCETVGCSKATVSNYAPVLGGAPYTGPWAGRRPLLFEESAVSRLRELLEEQARAKRAAMREHWRLGTFRDARPRHGRQYECARAGCHNVVYRAPHELTDDRVFCSHSCSSLDMWWNTTQILTAPNRVPLKMIGEHWSPVKKRAWSGRLNGAKGTTEGIEARAKNAGRPPLTTPQEKEQVLRLVAEGKSDRAIARIVFRDPTLKNRVFRIRHR